MKSIQGLLGTVLVLSISLLHALAAAQETRTVLIGFAGQLSSPLTRSGQYAAQLAINEANRTPLIIDGKKITFQLLAMDDKGEPGVARYIAGSLSKAGVVGVIGHWTSEPTSAAADIYNQTGVPHISPSAAAPDYTTKGYDTSFRSIGSSEVAATAISRFIVQELRSKRVAILDDDSFFGAHMADIMEDEIKENNIRKENNVSIIAREITSNKTSDFNSVLMSFAKDNADLIFFSGYLQRSEDLVRAHRRLNISAQLFLTGAAVNEIFLSLTPADSEGIWATAPGKPYFDLPEYKKFEKNFRSKYQASISSYTLSTYDATNTLIAAIRQARSLDRKKLISVLHKIRHKGMLGTVTFDDNGNLQRAAYTIYRVQQQRWTVVKTYE